MKLVIATTNANKLREYRELFAPFKIEVLGLEDVNYTKEIEETGTTFAENAIIKAETVSKALNCLVVADDSGLSIHALDNFPGIHSARFMEGHSYQEKCAELIRRVKPYKDRSCDFTCAIALAIPNQATQVVEGKFYGEVATSYRGSGGFGYDPIFLVPSLGKTVGELGEEVKNTMSHRYLATTKLIALMKKAGIIE
ncbi:MAG: RdgB/HAM1 family non-canonical purine NTP pyrophosphatase [Bacilli bacterium]|nr:RdgB/HAM1 family non-canonical purine NTP pyrophosphatase [Bacilli bacterium]